MSEYVHYNLMSYLNSKRNKTGYLVFVLILFLLFILFGSITKIQNTYTVNAKTICEQECTLQFYLPTPNEITYSTILIHNQKYEVEEIFLEEIQLDTQNNAYQNYTLKLKEYKGNDKEIVVVKLLKNKENFIQKIIKIIRERK